MTEGTGASGGFAVPPEFSAQLIRNVEQYGVLERNAMRVPMARDTMIWPKRTGGLTVYYPDEGTAPTASDVSLGQVQLIARKWMTLTYVSSELDEDAVISIAELIAFEFSQAIAYAQDNNGFNGTGTSTYGRIDGLLNKVGSAGLKTAAATEDLANEVSYETFASAIGCLPGWAAPGARWFMNFSVLWAQLGRTYSTTGELLVKEVMFEGVRRYTFLGLPVEITQALPGLASVSASTKFAVVGDLQRGVMLGRRGGVDLATSDQYKFAEDQIAFRGRLRQDIQVHEPGDSSNAGAYAVVKSGTES